MPNAETKINNCIIHTRLGYSKRSKAGRIVVKHITCWNREVKGVKELDIYSALSTGDTELSIEKNR